jgi:hypothetical protein
MEKSPILATGGTGTLGSLVCIVVGPSQNGSVR